MDAIHHGPPVLTAEHVADVHFQSLFQGQSQIPDRRRQKEHGEVSVCHRRLQGNQFKGGSQ